METGTLSQQFDRLRDRRFRLLIAALSLVVPACATAGSTKVNDGPITYQVTSLATPQGQAGPTQAVLWLDEEFAVLDGNTGCHRILGSFTLNNATGDASFTVPGASTGICEPSELQTEEWLLAALDRVTSFQRVGQLLELVDSTGSLQIELEPIS